MSDPLSIVQAAYAAFGRGDLPAVLELLASLLERMRQSESDPSSVAEVSESR